jgi:hypothetical protein
MKILKSIQFKIIASLLVVTLVSEDIAQAGDFFCSKPADNLQVQSFAAPIENPILLHTNYIKFTLGYILNRVPDIENCNRRYFEHRLINGIGFVFDFRADPANPGKGRRLEGENWIIPCALGDANEIRKMRVYRWPYEAVVGGDKKILGVRRRGEAQDFTSAPVEAPDPAAVQELPPAPKESAIRTAVQTEQKKDAAETDAQSHDEDSYKRDEGSLIVLLLKDLWRPFRKFFDSVRSMGLIDTLKLKALIHDVRGLPAGLRDGIVERATNQVTWEQFFQHERPYISKSPNTNDIVEAIMEIEHGDRVERMVMADPSFGKRLRTHLDMLKSLQGLGMSDEHIALMYSKLYHKRLLAGISPKALLERARNLKALKLPLTPKLLTYDKDALRLSAYYGLPFDTKHILLREEDIKKAAIEHNVSIAASSNDSIVRESRALFLFRLSRGDMKTQDLLGAAMEKLNKVDRDRINALIDDERGEYGRAALGRRTVKNYFAARTKGERRVAEIAIRQISRALRSNSYYREQMGWFQADPDSFVLALTGIKPKDGGLIALNDRRTYRDCLRALKMLFPEARAYSRAKFETINAADKFKNVAERALDRINISALGGMPAYARAAVIVLVILAVLPVMAAAGSSTLTINPDSPAAPALNAASDLNTQATYADILGMAANEPVTIKAETQSNPLAAFIDDRPFDDIYKDALAQAALDTPQGYINAAEAMLKIGAQRDRTSRWQGHRATVLYSKALSGLNKVSQEAWERNAPRLEAASRSLWKGKGSLEGVVNILYPETHEQTLSATPASAPPQERASSMVNTNSLSAGIPAPVETLPDIKPGSRTALDPDTGKSIVVSQPINLESEQDPDTPVLLMPQPVRAIEEPEAVMPAEDIVKVSLSDIVDAAIKNARQIRQAEYWLERAGLRVKRAQAGRAFWDLKLIYDSNGDTSGSAAIDTQTQGARDDAAQVSIDRQNLADAEAALANDEARLAQAQANLERNTAQRATAQENLERNTAQLADAEAALANDQEQLEEAIREGDQDRIIKEQGEIEEDDARVSQETSATENNRANVKQETAAIENNRSRISRIKSQIAHDKNEIRLRRARLAADEEKLRLRLKKIEELRKPELRLRSDAGVELVNPDRSRDVGAQKAGKKQSRIALEQAKLEACGRVIQLHADILELEANTNTLSACVLQLTSLYEKAVSLDSSYDMAIVGVKLAAAKRDLAEGFRRLADRKSELRHLQRWPEGMRFNIDENAYQPEAIERVLRERGVALDRYYSLLLANKAGEVEYYHAQVPSAFLSGIGVKMEAVWREDILRRFMVCSLDEEIASQELAADQAALELDIQQREIAMQNGDTERVALKDAEIAADREGIKRDEERIKNSRDYLRDPTFIGLRGSITFGDPKRSKASRQALLAWLKAVDEYIALERTAETARDNAARAAQAAEASYKEAASIAQEADANVRNLETRYNAGLGTLGELAAGVDEAKDARLARARSANSRTAAAMELARARYSTRMELEKLRPDDLEKILDAMKDYRKYFRRGNAEAAEKAWRKVAEYMPDLMRPESSRQIESYVERIRGAIKNTTKVSVEEKRVSDDLSSYITKHLSAEDRRSLTGLVSQYGQGRWTISNILRGTVMSKSGLSAIMDKMKAMLPLVSSPEEVALAARSLGAAPYNVRTPSLEELVQTAINRGATAPAARDVEMARNAARNDVNLFMPIISASGTLGAGTDILDMQSADLTGPRLRNNSGASVSATIPLTDPGRNERLESGKGFVTAALARQVMAERTLRTQTARQLVAVHSNMVECVALGERAANMEERIRILKNRPDSSGPQIDSLERARRVIIMRQNEAARGIEDAKNGLKDVLKLGPADIVTIENVTDTDIESALGRLRESLKGNFVLESAAGDITAGSMIIIGADNRVICNGRKTSLSVSGIRNIKNVAVRDRQGKQAGQFVIDAVTGAVVRSDIRSIPKRALVLIHEDATISVTRPNGKSGKIDGLRAADVFDHRILSLTDASGGQAGMVRIDPGTGDDALIFGEHRALRRAYALSSAAIKKEGDAVSFVFTAYPLSAGGILASASPAIPDSWIDKVPVVRKIFGARARQAAREVSGNIAMGESKRQDVLLQSAENIAAKQREAAVRMYRLTRQKADTARKGFENCGALVKKLEADQAKLPDTRVLPRARSDMSALARIAEQADNNLAEIEILLASLDIGERELAKDEDQNKTINIDEALPNVGQRVTDELARIDIAIARELKGLASLASMFDGEMAAGIGAYRSRNEDAAGWKTPEDVVNSVAAAGSSAAPAAGNSAVFTGTASFRFRPRLYTRELAELNAEDARIIADMSIETARETAIGLYREYAMAAVREASAASKAGALAGLVDIAGAAGQAGLKSNGELVAARAELERAEAARLDAGRALVTALTELAKLVETKTGVAVDPRSFLPAPASAQDIRTLSEQFGRSDRSRDSAIQDIGNRREQARLEKRQAWWTILPTLGADLKWSGAASGIDQTYEASVRILGSVRSIRAKLARIKAKNLEDSERNRISELQYRWELIEHELSAAAEEARTLEDAIRAIDSRIGVVLEDMSAQYALTTIDTSQEMRRLVSDYEDLKARCVEARIRRNIAYALAAEMLTNLGVNVKESGEGATGNATIYDPYGRAIDVSPVKPAEAMPEALRTGSQPMPAPAAPGPEKAAGTLKPAQPSVPPQQPETVTPPSSEVAPTNAPKVETAVAQTQPAPERAVSAAGPDGGAGFFGKIRQRIGQALADFSGKKDDPGTPVICEVEPLWAGPAGDARATLIWYAEDGRIVAEGEGVAEFDSTLQTQQRDEQRRVVGQAQAALDEAGAALRYALALSGIYDDGYYAKSRDIAESGISAGVSMSDLAAQNAARAGANIEILHRQVQRVEAILHGRIASSNDLARAAMLKNDGDAAAIIAVSDVASAERMVNEASSGTNLVNAAELSKNAEIDGLVERARASVGTARGILQSQEERLRQLERNVTNCVVRAPRAGRIKHDIVVGAYPVEPVPHEMTMRYGLTVGCSNALPMRIVDAKPGEVNRERSGRFGVTSVQSRARTAGDSRLGTSGLTVEKMVPEGAYVEKGQPMTWYSTSVARDNRSEDEALLKEHAALAANYAASAKTAGEFRSVTPKNVLSFRDRTWGAWELVGRCSYLNLDDKNLGISGGSVVDTTLGLNWYLNPSMRLMLNWVHSDRAGYGSLNGIQTRAQWNFD